MFCKRINIFWHSSHYPHVQVGNKGKQLFINILVELSPLVQVVQTIREHLIDWNVIICVNVLFLCLISIRKFDQMQVSAFVMWPPLENYQTSDLFHHGQIVQTSVHSATSAFSFGDLLYNATIYFLCILEKIRPFTQIRNISLTEARTTAPQEVASGELCQQINVDASKFMVGVSRFTQAYHIWHSWKWM